MTAINTSETASSAPPVSLKGNLGVGSIVFMVVAAAGPLTVVGGGAPLGILLGNGAGYPMLFLALGIVLLFFSVGLSAMATRIPRAGAFFTYTGYGLSPAWGAAAAWTAVVTYVLIHIAVYAFLGLQLQGLVGTASVPWWVYSLLMVAATGFLGYNRIDLSSKVLGVLLVLEVTVVLVLSLVVVARSGASGIDLTPFTPEHVFSGDLGIGIMFAAASFIGFESTAIYRDEARDPERTIPRATYLTVILITAFYVFAVWALIEAWGVSEVVRVAGETLEAGDMLQQTGDLYIGQWYATAISLLIITSMFACVLSFHNVLTRYYQSMGRAGLLPRAVAAINVRRNAPSRASLLQSVISAALILGFAVAGLDPYLQVFTWFSGVATLAFLLLMVLVSVAVVVYFRRSREDISPFKSLVAPTLGGLGLLASSWMVLVNFPLLVGDVDANGSPQVGALTICLVAVTFVFPIGGLIQARYLARFRRAKYHDLLETLS